MPMLTNPDQLTTPAKINYTVEMANLFRKAAVFTDIHFGLKSNSLLHLQDCEKFVDWFIDVLATKFIWRNRFSWERYWVSIPSDFFVWFVYGKHQYQERWETRKICRQNSINLTNDLFWVKTVSETKLFFLFQPSNSFIFKFTNKLFVLKKKIYKLINYFIYFF